MVDQDIDVQYCATTNNIFLVPFYHSDLVQSVQPVIVLSNSFSSPIKFTPFENMRTFCIKYFYINQTNKGSTFNYAMEWNLIHLQQIKHQTPNTKRISKSALVIFLSIKRKEVSSTTIKIKCTDIGRKKVMGLFPICSTTDPLDAFCNTIHEIKD